MLRSESVAQLAAALAGAQADLRNPPCDRTNPAYHSRYATLASVLDTVRAPLAAHGLAAVQGVTVEAGRVAVETTILHKSGEWIASTASAPADANIQRMGSSITYLRRYTLTAMLGIVGDDDDDAQSQVAPARAGKASTRPPKERPPKERPPAGSPSAPPETAAAPAGYERLYPAEVVEKTKDGKTWWVVRFNDPKGPPFTARTFSSTIGALMAASIDKPIDCMIEEKRQDDKVYFNIREVI